MQMTSNQPKTSQNRRIFRELNNVRFAELPSLLVESLHTLFAVAVGRAGFTYRLKPRASRSKEASNKLWYA